MTDRQMMKRDRASASLGMVVERDDIGHAVVSMVLRDDMMNGHDITHGGFVFALADTAFAIACNDDVTVTVAAGADITFLKPTTTGQTLARHRRRARPPRTHRHLRRHRRRRDGGCGGRVPRPERHDEAVRAGARLSPCPTP